jgi:hypothetical protein
MSELPDDRELREFLAGRGEVSRRYRQALERESTPPELDEIVLKLAGETAHRPVRRRWRSLRLPLALAATVVLSFSVFVGVREEQKLLPQPQVSAPAPRAEAEEAPAALQDEAKLVEPQPQEPQRRDQPKPKRAPRQTDQAAGAGRVEQRAAPNAAMSPPVQEKSARKQESYAPQAAPPAPAELMSAPAPAPAMGASRRSFAAESDDAQAATNLDETKPDAWIVRIRTLRDQPDVPAARRELERFRHAFPQYALPEDLQSLLHSAPPDR